MIAGQHRGARSGLLPRRAVGLAGAVLVLTLAISPGPARAQGHAVFESLSIEHGLPQSQVSALSPDARGSLWIGTLGGGLSRFNGRTFETFTTSQGLSGDRVRALAQDPEGRLWIGTGAGLTVLDAGTFRVLQGTAPDETIHALLPMDSGEVWVGSNRGLRRYHRRTLARMEGGPDLNGVGVTALLQDQVGRVWIGTDSRGVAHYEAGRLSFLDWRVGSRVHALLETRGGSIWIATDAGVFVHDGTHLSSPFLGTERGRQHVNALLEDTSGNIWLATAASGVCRHRQGETTCFSEDDGLGSNTVWALAEDHEANVWVGTYRGGLSRFLGSESLDPRLQKAMSDVVVRSILEDRRGRLWFATDDRGVLVVDGTAMRWLGRRDGLSHDFVITVIEDREGAMWFGTLGGLTRYDGRSFRRFDRADGLPDTIVRSVVQDPAGVIWVGTNEGGVARWDGHRFHGFDTSRGLNADAVNVLHVDRSGRLWAGTARGLSAHEGDRFSNASRRLGITEGNVYSIGESPANGDLWLGVFGEGLVRIPQATLSGSGDSSSVPPQVLTTRDGLSNDRVVSLTFDARGDLWVGTETGIDRLHPTLLDPSGRPAIDRLGTARGRGHVECIHNAALTDRSGRVWLGTLRGPRLYDPRFERANRAAPRAWITALGPVPGDWSWTPRLDREQSSDGVRLSLPHDENHLAFGFEAVSLSAASDVRYQFRLEGYDEDWSPVTASDQAFYPNLPPGEFRFRARASLDGRTWVEAPNAFGFRVEPPFWRRGWFFTLALGALVFLVYGGHRVSMAQLTKHRRALQAEVTVRQRTEEELRRTNRALRLIGECNQVLVRAADESELLDGVCRLLVKRGGYRLAWVGYAERDAERSVRPVASAGLDEGYVASARVSWADDERGRGPTGTAIRTGRPAIAHDVRSHPRFGPWRKDALRRGFSSSIALPLTRHGETLGALSIYAAETDGFNDQEVELLTELADDLAYGITALRSRVERERAEAGLKASQQMLQTIIHTIPHHVFWKDRELRYLGCNELFARSLGFEKAADVVGKTDYDLGPEQAELYRADDRRVIESGEPRYRYVEPQTHLDGTELWLETSKVPLRDAEGGVLGVLGVYQDVTEQKRAQEALRQSEQRLKSIVGNVPVVLFALDASGIITLSEGKGLEKLGLAPGEVVGRSVFEVCRDYPAVCEHVRQALASQVTQSTLALGEISFDVSYTPLAGPGGEAAGLLGVAMDVSDRERAEQAQRERARLATFEAEVATALVQSGSLRDMLQPCCEAMVRHLDAAFGRIWTLDRNQELLELQASAGMYTHLDGPHGRVGVGDLKIGLIAQRREPHLTNAVVGDPQVHEQDWARREGMAAFAGYPLVVEDRLVGVMAMFARQPLAEATLQALAPAANVIASAIERKRGEEALRESEETARGLLNATSDEVLLLDGKGRVLALNERAGRAFGRAPGEVVGRSVFEFLPADVGEPRREQIREAVHSGRPRRFEDRHAGRWLDNIVFPLFDASGHTARVAVFARDITDRRATEDALRESEARFRRLAEGSPDIIFRAGPRGVDYISPACLPVSGYAPEEFAAEPRLIRRIVHPDDRGRLGELNRRLRDGLARAELRIRHKDGHVVWTEVSIIPIRDDSGGRVAVEGVVRDVTARRLAEEARQQTERRFRALIEHSSDLVSVIDGEATILYTSPSTTRIMGYAPPEPVGRSLLDLVHPDDLEKARALLRQLKAEPEANVMGELRLRHHGGAWRWLGLTGTNLLAEPAVEGLVLNYRDITGQKQAEAQLQHDALHDALTGLPNRALLVERLERTLSRSRRRPSRRFAVLFLDLDGFKFVNDSLGHDAGDRLLVALAPRLEGCLRSSDTCARLGGDEFVLLLDEVGDVVDAADVAERVQQQLRLPFDFEGREVRVSASIGIVIGSAAYERPEDLLRDADIAMYRAKARGRSRHEIFDVEMRVQAVTRLEFEGALRRALERKELRVFYQPIVSLRSGRLKGFEALVRWQHPERGLMLPAEFIHLAEDGMLIVPLDHWVLGEACRQMREWRAAFPAARLLTMNVNVSSRHFAGPGLAEEIGTVLRETGLEARCLELEITEGAIMGNLPVAGAVLQELRGLGVRAAIDDFGTGYSSLSYLVQLAVDTLKIDRSFVGHLVGPDGRAEIVRSIVSLAHSLQMGVIAEGVENTQQRSRLRALGCESGQGYLISKPLSSEAATDLLASNVPRRRPSPPRQSR